MVSARFTIFHVVFALALGMVLFWLFVPPFYVNDRGFRAEMRCLTKLKQLGSSFQIYPSDFDGGVPHQALGSPKEPFPKKLGPFHWPFDRKEGHDVGQCDGLQAHGSTGEQSRQCN